MNNFEDILNILRPDIAISSLLQCSITEPRDGKKKRTLSQNTKARDAPASFTRSPSQSSSNDDDDDSSSGASASSRADLPPLDGWTPDQLQAFARALQKTKNLKCQSAQLPKDDAGRSMYEHWFRMQHIAADAAWEEPDGVPPVLLAPQVGA
eukprot:CAMPEP_0113687320 /NCGR_PEP_ID=MMETSP0038_2-20120614/15857_1 /TAXON_ID=2898 /ORGANISM="Cryptomonas paramecium" /LENGTH=151 /DNA_ID=CAMNT_0000607895 /DNA_START=69 /DNA_END=523 /DNA_ORIENTATION=- /assembly_acc=CAM_ASM_000170